MMVSKGEAVAQLAPRLPVRHREVLTLAQAGYLGEAIDHWTHRRSAARAAADHLVSLVALTAGRDRTQG